MKRLKLLFILVASLWGTSTFAREVELSWEPFENALGYHIVIAKSSDFKKNPIKKAVKDPTISLNLDIGVYFYKVRAIDTKKQSGHWSEPMKFEVTPYPPELKLPKSESSYSYFEIPPKIEFTWKPVDDPDVEYEIFIYKTTGKKAFEAKTKETQITVTTLLEGEYMWKLRTIYKGIYESTYVEPRRFVIEKKEMTKPVLVNPGQDGQLPAYQGFTLEWKKDPVAVYSDVALAYKDEETGKGSQIEIPKNIKDATTFQVEKAEPGEYKWKVRAKEGEDTQGMESETATFRLRKDLISENNSSFYYGLGYMTKTLNFKNRKVNPEEKGAVRSRGFITRGGGSYFLSEGFGFHLDLYAADIKQLDWELPESGWTLTSRMRMGTPGFNQHFVLGLRQANEYEMVDLPSKSYQLHTIAGPVIGTQLNGSLSRNMRMNIELLYFKPLSSDEGYGSFSGDVYEGGLSIGYNVSYKFWISFDARYRKGVFTSSDKGASNFQYVQWDSTVIEPAFLKLSFEN